MPFCKILKNRKRSRLRSILRGYLILKRKKYDKIADIKRLLADQDLKIGHKNFSHLIIGKNIDKSLYEVCIKQYLLLRIGSHSLDSALLSTISQTGKKLVYPMPNEWRLSIEEHGFLVSHWRSECLWRFYLLGLVGYSFFKMLKIIIKSILGTFVATDQLDKYVYFSNLSNLNIPKKPNLKMSYDIISWYIKTRGDKYNISLIKHDAKDSSPVKLNNVCIKKSNSGPIPYLVGWKNICIFFLWGVSATFLSLWDLIRGRWWHAFILNQSILSKQIMLTHPTRLAKEYLFHNSSQTYRPLWTYDAEKFGAKITLYFYSTNIEGFKSNNSYSSATYAWRCMTWPRYLVWDQMQADFVRRVSGPKVVIETVGTIWFSDSSETLIPDSKDKIAVFGVTPHRVARSCLYGNAASYYSPDNCIAFLEHVFNVSEKINYNCFFKMKRDPGTLVEKK